MKNLFEKCLCVFHCSTHSNLNYDYLYLERLINISKAEQENKAYTVPEGVMIVGAGPILCYYEFKYPREDRLTDEAWREMLESDPPENPGWVGGIGG